MGTDHVYCKTGFGRSVRETIRNEERHMADPTGSPDGGSEHDPARPAGTPAWVKVFAVIAVVLIAMLGVMLLSGGDHGPGRHTSGGAGGQAPTSSAVQSGVLRRHDPPPGAHIPR